jgi:hypothetical protein
VRWVRVAKVVGDDTDSNRGLIPVRAPVLLLTDGRRFKVMQAAVYDLSARSIRHPPGARGRMTESRRGVLSELESLPLVDGHQVEIHGVPVDEVAHERAHRQHGPALRGDCVQRLADQYQAKALSGPVGIRRDLDEGDYVAGTLVGQKAHHLAVDVQLEAAG